jgi:hypothetical protein
MAKKDPANKIRTAVNLITVSTYDSLVSDLDKLNLDHESYQSVVDLIERKKDESVLEVKGKKKGHAVPADRRCKNESSGKQCRSFICDKTVGLCWVHMSDKQKKAYKAKNKSLGDLD